MTADRAAPVFHIALPQDWAAARATGHYAMSQRGRHLDDAGFVHLSFVHQVEATANRYYRDLDHVVLLTVDPARCEAALVVEPGTGTVADRFPHLYGALPVAAVTAAHTWRRAADGQFHLDPAMVAPPPGTTGRGGP